MFESIINFFKKIGKQDKEQVKSKDTAKERLHLVLMQDRANVSADFLDLMKQEIIEVIKKYIDVDENAIDVRLTNKANMDGVNGAPALYANIPIVSIKEEVKNKMARQGDFVEKENEEPNVKEENINEIAKQDKKEENVNKIVEQNKKEENVNEIVEQDKKEENVNEIVEQDKKEENVNETIEQDKKEEVNKIL